MAESDGPLRLDDAVGPADGDVLPEDLQDHVLGGRLLHEATALQGTVSPLDDDLLYLFSGFLLVDLHLVIMNMYTLRNEMG